MPWLGRSAFFYLDALPPSSDALGQLYSVPPEGRTTIFSTVVFSGKRSAFTTVLATLSADIILRRGACGHSVFQIAVSVAPGISAITRIPFGLSSSRRVFVNPS